MTIEFHTQYGKVPELLVNTIRKEVIAMSRINKRIARAEVLLKEVLNISLAENKLCEIKLNVYGENIAVRSRTANFEQSAKEVIRKLKKLVMKQVENQSEAFD
ncbi:MAG TPA: HPF/RaiA family ribosome-associated protein [Ferruginibacter sp.]|nr:HPF/RaiA family ribosome-associated protein [Ferruginibacter sp.]